MTINRSKKIVIIGIFILSATKVCWAQYPGEPTFHDSYYNFYIFGGYQYLNHQEATYNTATIQAEMLYSFFGSRIGMTLGPDYYSFSPCGIFLFAPKIFIETINGESGNPAILPFMLIAVSAAQWHIPLTDHLEISLGWDALKFTKFKNFSDKYYVQGSLNAGLICFLGDHFFLSSYYEFNHTHNPMIKAINWALSDLGESLNSQPNILNGHSFGVRIGVMF